MSQDRKPKKERSAYSTLNLRKGSTDEEIKKAYLTLVKRFDPERHTDRFMIIQNAYERLSNPTKRAKEDIISFNPVSGRFMYLDEEKEEKPEDELAAEIAQLEKGLSGGNGAEADYQRLALALMRHSLNYVKRQQRTQAIESWERILQIDPTHQRAKNNLIYAYSSLAYSYAEHGLNDEAIDLWVKASQMNPDDDAVIHNLALATEQGGRQEESDRYWTETMRRWKVRLDASPEDEFLRNSLLEAHRLHGGKMIADTKRPEEGQRKAVEQFQEILKIDPNDFEAQFQVAAALMEERKWAEAILALNKVVKNFPRNVEALNLLGWAQVNAGQIDQGFITWRNSLILDPKNPATMENITRAHLELGKKSRDQGQFNNALKHFKSLLKFVGPKNSELRFEIGSTYFMKGDKRSAYLELKACLEVDPRNMAAKKLIQELRMR